jgi:hypothetical protein
VEDDARCRDAPKHTWMSDAYESLEARVLLVIEELLKDPHLDQRHVDTSIVLQRMRQPAEAEAEVAEAMSELLAKGDIRGKENRGDNRVLDVTVLAITNRV